MSLNEHLAGTPIPSRHDDETQRDAARRAIASLKGESETRPTHVEMPNGTIALISSLVEIWVRQKYMVWKVSGSQYSNAYDAGSEEKAIEMRDRYAALLGAVSP